MKILIRICGVFNLLFAAFHIWLGFSIARLPVCPQEAHELMKMLNAGGTLFILFMGMALTFVVREVSSTILGRLILILGAATYLLRAAEELFISTHVNVPILGTCLLVGILHLVAFLMLRCPCRNKPVLPDSTL